MPFNYLSLIAKGPIPSNRKERFMALCKGRLARLPVLAHKGFKINFHEGYKHNQFGVISGPVLDVQAVVHDLAHVVEFGDKQFRRRSRRGGRMQFKLPRIWVFDRYCEEPTTGQASLREARTFGVQRRLNERLGIRTVSWDEDLRNMVNVLRHMPDWWIFTKDNKPLMKAMYKGYVEATDEVIDRRLEDWFTSAYRSVQRQALKNQAE